MTPPDIFSQIAIAVPTILLYEASIRAVTGSREARGRRGAAAAEAGGRGADGRRLYASVSADAPPLQ